MTFHTCRYCKKQGEGNYLKYGPRHYAHLACMKTALTSEAFEHVLRSRVSLSDIRRIPYFEAKELGILPLLREIDYFTQIRYEAREFPETFGLRGFPGKTFRISETSSYISGDTVQLYTQVQDGDRWLDFAKGTAAELRAQIVSIA